MKEMNDRWQFPFCRIAIDGCHILIKCPPGGAASCKEYHNFKNCYSVVLMAMVEGVNGVNRLATKGVKNY